MSSMDMPAVRIPITANDQTSNELNKVKTALKDADSTGKTAFNGISEGSSKARMSAMMLESIIGVKLPKALNTAMAKSQLMGPVLSAAFAGGAIGASIPIIMQVGDKIKQLSLDIGGYTQAWSNWMDELIKKNRELQFSFSSTNVGKMFLAANADQLKGAYGRRDVLEAQIKGTNPMDNPVLYAGLIYERKKVYDEIAKLEENEVRIQGQLTTAAKAEAQATKDSSDTAVQGYNKRIEAMNKLLDREAALQTKMSAAAVADELPQQKKLLEVETQIAEILKFQAEWQQQRHTMLLSLNTQLGSLTEQAKQLKAELQEIGTLDYMSHLPKDAQNQQLKDLLTVTPVMPEAQSKALGQFYTYQEPPGLKAWNTALKGVDQTFGNLFQDIALNTRGVGNMFQSMADSAIAALGRIIFQMTIMQLMMQAMNAIFGGLGIGRPSYGQMSSLPLSQFPSNNPVFAQAALAPAPHALGGPVLPNYPILVGEHGTEVWNPSSSGRIIPNDALGGAPRVAINVSNEGQPKDAQASQPQWDGEKWVIGVLLKDYQNNGPSRQMFGR
jgi:hypothetical protein